ncbi:SNF2-related protein [Anaerophaga thermohalophila]|uniref:SNF2-related protein n=1 Tax=Anaerophaga thermohalophila TaxID=177400 RepID=UPI000237B953|nr:SNF2-related protein [Anaerophaga thermohalophila]
MNRTDLHTDTTFFTNEPGSTLLDRFLRTLKDTQYFDVLVGYFRSSGFYQMYEAIEKVDKTRILVGLGVDEESYKTINEYQNQTVMDFDSHANAKKEYQKNLIKEIEKSKEVDKRLEIGIKKFIEFLQTDCPDKDLDIKQRGNGKKLEIKAYPSRNIHAKVYISRYHEDDKEYGSVITGSSNFSLSGLVANREFNVQLKDRRDVDYALDQFENLWKDAVDISEEFVDAVKNKTWLNDSIQPYELYLKLIYEYMQEDINLEENFESFLPEGFLKLDYQEQAVRQAMKKLEEYNGVFLADVVGLGKTFIAAQLLQQLRGKILVICPPVLKEYWEQSLMDFRVPAKVESLGKLEHIIRKGIDRWDYIVVDEAHRFRNEATQSYADLLDICRGKKVILVTATPLNNTIDDIFAQLKLFQAPKNSNIPGIINLEKFFNGLRKKLKKFEKHDPEYQEMIREVSKEIREKVLKHVMVRRTRNDVVNFFKKDIQQQGLAFPEMGDPQKIIYEYEGELERIFKSTIQSLAEFRYARYIPLLYYTGNKGLTEFEKQQQRNVGGFMKGILVKRLESSFYAFKQSVQRFIKSYERFINMYNDGTVYISKKVNVYDLLDNDDFDKLEKAVEEEKAQKYESKDFRKDFLTDLQHDLEVLKQVWALWKNVDEDPKLSKFIAELKKHEKLKKKQLVVFTESKETGDYLYEHLIDEFPGQVMFYSSEGGRHTDKQLTSKHTIARDIILDNFDPNSKTPSKDLRILIATDILAEGINLHRSNILINYDLPWNPTRVLQRAGRVNRLGTKHSNVYIFNFFPTTHSDEHLGLELNITNKIQMFHDILGEDAKYLSDGEEVGSRQLFDSLNNKKTYTGEDEEGDSELKYLEMMRNLRDKDPDLFEKIKKLPKKARSGRKTTTVEKDKLVTFFRLGKLKKFYSNQGGESEEITFFDAVNLLECKPETKRASIPSEKYFQMLDTNKARFELDTTQGEEDKVKGGASNVKYIEKRMKDVAFRRYKGFTDSDEEFILGVKQMIQQGLMAKKTAQKIKKELEKEDDPLQMLHILQRHIRSVAVDDIQNGKSPIARDVILSGYLIV